MAVTTKKLFPATSNATTTVFSPVGIQLNNQDDLDVYVTLSGGTRVLQLRQATGSTAQSSHPQVNNTDGLYFPAVTAGTTLYNYTLSTDNNTITFNSALPQGAVVFCERRTRDADSSYTTFASGSTIRATDLNNSSTESNFTAQDGRNKALTIEGVLFDGDQPSTNFVTSSHIVDGSIVNADINASANIAGSKLANDSVTLDKLGSGALPTDITVASANIVNGTIVEADLSNSAITANKIADGTVGTLELTNGAVTTDKIANGAVNNSKIANSAVDTSKLDNNAVTREKITADAVDSTKLADNAVNSEHYVDGSIDREHLEADIIDSTKLADNAVGSEHIQTNAVTDSEIATGTLDNRYFTETELTNGALDGRYFTETESDARYFNISSGETITSGDTFPDNDNTIATTKAINARIIDIVNDVGGFDIVESEQHFPNTNPQGQAGSAAVLSIKAASTNLVPSGTTLTISNGNLANNANITITGVTSTIPSGFGFIVESTGTLHTYTFHRLVPKATEVTTVAGNITNINAAANNESNINAAVSNASNINAAVSNASNITAVAGNASNINAAVSNASNINAAVSNASNITTTASNITNVNNVGNNVTNVNSVSNSTGANQTFTVTVQNVSGNKYFIDGVQTPVLKLARGKTYTFDMSDSSNGGHPLAFRDSSDNSYTTGVTTSGTAGSSGATVVIVVAANAPSSLKYYCTSHGNAMGNTITVIDDNVGLVAGSISNVNTVGGAITNVNNVGNSISNVNTVATNINNVNDFFDKYRVGSSNPSTSLDTGDLFFNTTTNSLKVYTGSAWVDGVTTTGNFALKTGNTFTGDNIYNDNVKLKLGTGSDLEIFHDGNNSLIRASGTGDLNIYGDEVNILNKAQSEFKAKLITNGAVELYYDNSKKFETTSSGVTVTGTTTTGNLTLNSTFPTILLTDSDHNNDYSIINGNGTFRITDTTIGLSRFAIAPSGNVEVANSLKILADNKKLQLGASQDLQLYHNGSNSFISNSTGSLALDTASNEIQLNKGTSEYMGRFITDGAVELYYDNSKKFETTSAGATITGRIQPSGGVWIGSDLKYRLYVNGVINRFDTYAREFAFINKGTDGSISPYMARMIPAGAVELYHNGQKRFETDQYGCKLAADNLSLKFGASDDLSLSHDGTNSLITHNTGSGLLRLNVAAGGEVRITKSGPETMAQFIADGAVRLYYNNSLKFETVSTGTLHPDDVEARFGTGGNDFGIYHDPTNNVNVINSRECGELQIRHYSEKAIVTLSNGAVELYHNNNKKLETLSTGVNVTGNFAMSGAFNGNLVPDSDSSRNLGANATRWANAFVDTYYGDGSNLTGINTDLVSDTSPQLGGDLASNGNDIIMADSDEIELGNSGDLKLYHDGSHSYINENGTGQLRILTNGFRLNNSANTENLIAADGDGAVELYYNGSKKFETYSGGVRAHGELLMQSNHFYINDNAKLRIGTGQDLQIYHDGTDSVIGNGTGTFQFLSPNEIRYRATTHHFLSYGNDETMAKFTDDGSVQLRYDNVTKAETASHGMYFNEAYLHHHVNSGNSSEIRFTTNGTRRGSIYADNGNTVGFTNPSGSWNARWHSDGKQTAHGHIWPNANNTYDLGDNSYRWRNIYTNDLNLSNEGSSNDVDGTWGNWTIQEGESDLFLKNNRSGKKYKFNLTEVS